MFSLIKVKDFGLYKQASFDYDSLSETRDIMRDIYNENPEYWPYGLNVEGHDEVYLIRDNLTKKACGFVGWQQHMEDGKIIGSYSIGIKPEFRGNGMAKEAVAKLLKTKVDKVDVVKSYIKSGNEGSECLARSLNIPIQHEF